MSFYVYLETVTLNHKTRFHPSFRPFSLDHLFTRYSNMWSSLFFVKAFFVHIFHSLHFYFFHKREDDEKQGRSFGISQFTNVDTCLVETLFPFISHFFFFIVRFVHFLFYVFSSNTFCCERKQSCNKKCNNEGNQIATMKESNIAINLHKMKENFQKKKIFKFTIESQRKRNHPLKDRYDRRYIPHTIFLSFRKALFFCPFPTRIHEFV